MRRLPLVVLLAAALLVPSGSVAPAATSGGDAPAHAAAKKKSKKKAKKRRRVNALKPVDFMKTKGLSTPRYTEFVTEVVELPMADGTDIYIEVTRPKAPGRYGVIMEASGYHGTLYPRTGTRILPGPLGKDGQPLGLKGYFPQFGYAVLMMDVRGTGKSGDCLDHMGPKDRSDLEEVIEWAASQDWSNGKVGLTGHSYVGGLTNLAGATGAKGLATIVPSASLGRMYDHQFQAGVPYNAQFLGPIEAYEQLALLADLPPGISTGNDAGALTINPTGDDFGRHPLDFGCGMKSTAAISGPGQVTGAFDKWHVDRDFYSVAEADIPIFYIHGINDEAARVAGMEWFTNRGEKGSKNANDKLWLGQWDHGIGCCPNRRGVQWTYALHAWFDKWLLGRKVNTGPPVEVHLNDDQVNFISRRKEVWTAKRWPPASKPATFVTGADAALAEGGGSAGSASFAGTPVGWVIEQDGDEVEFATKPFTATRVFIGVPKLELVMSQTMPQLNVIATLYDVDKQDRRRRLTQCAINPLLRGGLDHVEPVVPAQKMSMSPPCFAMAHRALPGHKFVLRVSTTDEDKLPFWSLDPNVTVFTGADGTKIELPDLGTPRTWPDVVPLVVPGQGGTGGTA